MHHDCLPIGTNSDGWGSPSDLQSQNRKWQWQWFGVILSSPINDDRQEAATLYLLGQGSGSKYPFSLFYKETRLVLRIPALRNRNHPALSALFCRFLFNLLKNRPIGRTLFFFSGSICPNPIAAAIISYWSGDKRWSTPTSDLPLIHLQTSIFWCSNHLFSQSLA